MTNFTNIFNNAVKNNFEFEEALDIVTANSQGDIWLIGGFVYRNIAAELYKLQRPNVDLDFIVELPITIDKMNLPDNWIIQQNKYGNPKFINGSKQIDFVPLQTVQSIIRRKLDASIVHFLTGTPLTIQSIAYDVHKREIIGQIGINAIKNKTVAINNLEQAIYAVQKKNKTLEQYIKEKADSLHFNPVLI